MRGRSLTLPVGRIDGCFRWSILVVQVRLEACKEALLKISRQHFAAAKEMAQGATLTQLSFFQNDPQHRRWEVCDGDLLLGHQPHEIGAILMSCRREQNERRA